MVSTFRARPELNSVCVDMIKLKLAAEGSEPGEFKLGLQRIYDRSAQRPWICRKK